MCLLTYQMPHELLAIAIAIGGGIDSKTITLSCGKLTKEEKEFRTKRKEVQEKLIKFAARATSSFTTVTFNLDDFPPAATLGLYDVEAIAPDDFVEHQFYLDQAKVLLAAKKHRAALISPPKTVDEYLETLARQEPIKTVRLLAPFGDFL